MAEHVPYGLLLPNDHTVTVPLSDGALATAMTDGVERRVSTLA